MPDRLWVRTAPAEAGVEGRALLASLRHPQALGTASEPRAPEGRCVRVGTHFHCERLAAASVLTRERAPLLVEGENVALEVEHAGVGSTAALPRAAAHIPFWGMTFHVLL